MALTILVLHSIFLLAFVVVHIQRFRQQGMNMLLLLSNAALILVWVALMTIVLMSEWPRHNSMPEHSLFIIRPDGLPAIMWIFKHAILCLVIYGGSLLSALFYVRWRIRRTEGSI